MAIKFAGLSWAPLAWCSTPLLNPVPHGPNPPVVYEKRIVARESLVGVALAARVVRLGHVPSVPGST